MQKMFKPEKPKQVEELSKVEKPSLENILFSDYIESSHSEKQIPAWSLPVWQFEEANYAVQLKYNPESDAECVARAEEFTKFLSQLIEREVKVIRHEAAPVRGATSKLPEGFLAKKPEDHTITNKDFTMISPASAEQVPTQLWISLSEKEYKTMRDHDRKVKEKNERAMGLVTENMALATLSDTTTSTTTTTKTLGLG
jgi:hypothetical protein